MKQLDEKTLQFENFDELKSFIKDGITYYGDQYSSDDIDINEDSSYSAIEDWFLNKEDMSNMVSLWDGTCFSKQFYIPLGKDFYPHIAFYVGINFSYTKYKDGSQYVDFIFPLNHNEVIEQQTDYIFLDKNGKEYDEDVIINIIEEADKFRNEDEKMIQFIKNMLCDSENVQDEIKELKTKYNVPRGTNQQ